MIWSFFLEAAANDEYGTDWRERLNISSLVIVDSLSTPSLRITNAINWNDIKYLVLTKREEEILNIRVLSFTTTPFIGLDRLLL